MRTALLSLALLAPHPAAHAQESGTFGGRQSLGVSASYSPNSSHMFIGQARQRRTWTSGFEYTHILASRPSLRVDYEGSVLPFFVESDPTITGTALNLTTATGTYTFTADQTPFRVIYVNRKPIGNAFTGPGVTAPIYAIYGRENTYGAALAPLGLRLSALPRARIRPSLSLDLGFVVSGRDLPVDLCDQFNYLFSFGPGIQILTNARSSIRVEYLYRHISNAGQGYQNPGVDQGTFRLTLSRYR